MSAIIVVVGKGRNWGKNFVRINKITIKLQIAMAPYSDDHDEKQTPPMFTAGEVKLFRGKSGQQEEEKPPQV